MDDFLYLTILPGVYYDFVHRKSRKSSKDSLSQRANSEPNVSLIAADKLATTTTTKPTNSIPSVNKNKDINVFVSQTPLRLLQFSHDIITALVLLFIFRPSRLSPQYQWVGGVNSKNCARNCRTMTRTAKPSTLHRQTVKIHRLKASTPHLVRHRIRFASSNRIRSVYKASTRWVELPGFWGPSRTAVRNSIFSGIFENTLLTYAFLNFRYDH